MTVTPPSGVPSSGNNGPSGGYLPPSGNGDRGSRNGSKGVVAGVLDLSNKIVGTLPPAFLLLILINAMFIGTVMWFLDSQVKQRLGMMDKLVDRCMDIALHAEPPKN